MDIDIFLKTHAISDQDLVYIRKQGKSIEDIIINYDLLSSTINKEGTFVHLQQALVEKDMVKLSDKELMEYEKRYDTEKEIIHPSQFIPASGFASRMFGYLESYLYASVTEQDNAKIMATIRGLDDRSDGPKFAFVNQLRDSLRLKGCSIERLITDSVNGDKGATGRIINEILYENGLNFKSLPKALLPFHHNGREPVLALKEHIENVRRSGKSKLCMVISSFHERQINAAIDRIRTDYPDFAEIAIDISFQRPETDSIAIDPVTREIIRDNTGTILFFPAGHGSLLSNIHETCHIRNIDNLPFGEHRLKVLSAYHKAMVVILTSLKRIIRNTIEAIDAGSISPQALDEKYNELSAMKFTMFLDFNKYSPADFATKKTMIREALNRPICICGLVKNTGEPGGGPFFYSIGNIVTSSIIERDEISPGQKELMIQGKFFNPVEILFDPTDYKGNFFDDLTHFEDNDRYIFVKKLFNGKPTIRLEYPGLWNGRMAKCNKVWIVLPSSTFAPVKELIDLLDEKHQTDSFIDDNKNKCIDNPPQG